MNENQKHKWLNVLSDKIKDKAETPEKDYYTSRQIADQLGKPWSTVREMINFKKETRKIDVKVYKIYVLKKLFHVEHYKLLDKPKKVGEPLITRRPEFERPDKAYNSSDLSH